MKKFKTKVYQYLADMICELLEMSIQMENEQMFERLMWWGIYIDTNCVYQGIYLD